MSRTTKDTRQFKQEFDSTRGIVRTSRKFRPGRSLKRGISKACRRWQDGHQRGVVGAVAEANVAGW